MAKHEEISTTHPARTDRAHDELVIPAKAVPAQQNPARVTPAVAPGQNPQQTQVDERGNPISANDVTGRRPGGQPFRENAPGATDALRQQRRNADGSLMLHSDGSPVFEGEEQRK